MSDAPHFEIAQVQKYWKFLPIRDWAYHFSLIHR